MRHAGFLLGFDAENGGNCRRPDWSSTSEQNPPTFVVFFSGAAVDAAAISPLLSLLLEAQSIFTLNF
jgi:hypothetical protein